jgi:hypothetical protein
MIQSLTDDYSERLLMLTQLDYRLLTDRLSLTKTAQSYTYSAYSFTYISRPLGTMYP